MDPITRPSRSPMKVPVKAPAAPPAGHYRWVICALLFAATTINYVDRGVLGVLAPELEKSIGWTDTQYGMAPVVSDLWTAVALIGLAAAAHQGSPRTSTRWPRTCSRGGCGGPRWVSTRPGYSREADYRS